MGERCYWQETIALTIGVVLWVSLACAAGTENFGHLREQMVQKQIVARGVQDVRVLNAMRSVPRHLFVPKRYRASSYDDHPLPIGEGQTISQPYIVAYMTEALELAPDDRVLEIGTGSGYQAAILAELVKEVYSVEIIESLANKSKKLLKELGYNNVWVKIGDGYKGWPEKAPFDAMIVTCAPDHVPGALVDQLREGGRMIIPVGGAQSVQKLVRAVKRKDSLAIDELLPVRFVPMIRGHE